MRICDIVHVMDNVRELEIVNMGDEVNVGDDVTVLVWVRVCDTTFIADCVNVLSMCMNLSEPVSVKATVSSMEHIPLMTSANLFANM